MSEPYITIGKALTQVTLYICPSQLVESMFISLKKHWCKAQKITEVYFNEMHWCNPHLFQHSCVLASLELLEKTLPCLSCWDNIVEIHTPGTPIWGHGTTKASSIRHGWCPYVFSIVLSVSMHAWKHCFELESLKDASVQQTQKLKVPWFNFQLQIPRCVPTTMKCQTFRKSLN